MLCTFYPTSPKIHSQKNIIYFNDYSEGKNGKEYGFLSPYYPCNFRIHRKLYHNVLQFYYATKFESWEDIVSQINFAHSAQEVYLIAKSNSLKFKCQYSYWKAKRLKVMKKAMKEKFYQNPILMYKLRITGNSRMIYINSKSKFWGSSIMNSLNMMGYLLIKIRDENKKNFVSIFSLNKKIDIIKEKLENKTLGNFKTILNSYEALNHSAGKIEFPSDSINITSRNPQILKDNSKAGEIGILIPKKNATNLKTNTLGNQEITSIEKYEKYESIKPDQFDNHNDFNPFNSSKNNQLSNNNDNDNNKKAKLFELCSPLKIQKNKLDILKQDPIEFVNIK